MSKYASNCFGEDYLCKKEWGKDCFVQCGDSGVVISNEGNYFTAFFEAFPKNPKTFIRGEGKNIEEAERNAWNEFQKYKNCLNHEFERKGYTNGAGFCKHCGLFKSKCFEPSTKCKICNKPTSYSMSEKGDYYCKEHSKMIPYEDMNWYQKENFDRKKREHITTLKEIENYVFEEYFVLKNQKEISHLKEFMKDIFIEIFIEICRKDIKLNDINNANIEDKYRFAIKNDFFSIDIFRRKYEFLSYKKYSRDNVDLIAVKFKEQDKYIYMFSLSTKDIINLIKFYENKMEG